MVGINAKVNSQLPILIAGARQKVQRATGNVHANAPRVIHHVLEFLRNNCGLQPDATNWLECHISCLQMRHPDKAHAFKVLPADNVAIIKEPLGFLSNAWYDVNDEVFDVAVQKAADIYAKYPELDDPKWVPPTQVASIPTELLERFEKLEQALVDGFESENASREEAAQVMKEALREHKFELKTHGDAIAATFGHANMKMQKMLEQHAADVKETLQLHTKQLGQAFGVLNERILSLTNAINSHTPTVKVAIEEAVVTALMAKVDEYHHTVTDQHNLLLDAVTNGHPTSAMEPTPPAASGKDEPEEEPPAAVPFVSRPPLPTEPMIPAPMASKPPAILMNGNGCQKPIAKNSAAIQQWWNWSLAKWRRGPRLLLVGRRFYSGDVLLGQVAQAAHAANVEFLCNLDDRRLERIVEDHYDVIVIMPPEGNLRDLGPTVMRLAGERGTPVLQAGGQTATDVVEALVTWAKKEPRIPGAALTAQ